MQEIWKDVIGYEGLYQVSNFGNVKSCRRTIIRKNRSHGYNKYPVSEKVLTPVNQGNGYYRVRLQKGVDSKFKLVHRLVAEAFIPNPDNLPCVNHKDENPSNNSMNNLEWCSYYYNNHYNNATAHRIDGVKQNWVKRKKLISEGKKETRNRVYGPASEETKRKMSESQKRRWEEKRRNEI